MAKVKVAKKWYAISVEANKEGRVKTDVKRKAKIEGLDHLIGRILSPTEKKIEKRNTDKGTQNVTKYEKKFPGYLVVFCCYCDELFHLFNDINGFHGFLPLGTTPIAIEGPEIQHVLNLNRSLSEKTPEKKVVLNYKVGDEVLVVRGMFTDMKGIVKEIGGTEAEPIITITVTIFGRQTDVPQLPYNHLKKA